MPSDTNSPSNATSGAGLIRYRKVFIATLSIVAVTLLAILEVPDLGAAAEAIGWVAVVFIAGNAATHLKDSFRRNPPE